MLADPGIVRNRLKVRAAINNAQEFLIVQDAIGSFNSYIWRFVEGIPIRNQWRSIREVPTRSQQSEALSQDLKHPGFAFAGTTIYYALMQTTGLVKDHLVSCFRHSEVNGPEEANELFPNLLGGSMDVATIPFGHRACFSR